MDKDQASGVAQLKVFILNYLINNKFIFSILQHAVTLFSVNFMPLAVEWWQKLQVTSLERRVLSSDL